MSVCARAGALAAVLVTVSASFAAGAPVQAAAAEPTMGPLIAGASSLVAGTHVWTDYPYDDRGANAGTASADNAADLIQLQLRPGETELGIRAVLETLLDAKVPLLGVGLDLDANPATGAPGLPGSGWKVAGTPLGLDRLVLVDHNGARVQEWRRDRWNVVGRSPAAVRPGVNTIATTVPNRLLGRAGPRWRAVGALGRVSQSWADGKGPIEDLAFVRDAESANTLQPNFQSNAQAAVLAGRQSASAAVARLDIARLRRGPDAPARPEAGIKNTFLYRSGLNLGEGIAAQDNRKYAGPYQPYVAWFPARGLPARPPLIVFLHGAMSDHLNGSYYAGFGSFAEAGPVAVGPGSIDPKAVIVTPLGRGETPLGYDGAAEQDVLDVIADASKRFGVDEERVALTGYSLGGVGTFRFAQLYPDRWAGAVEIVGAPDLGAITAEEEAGGKQTLPNQLENLRNLQFRMAHSRADELELIVGGVQPDKAALELHRLGYDYRYWQFYRRDHVTFPVKTIQCELEAAIARGRVRNPARVVYSQEPAIESRDASVGLSLHHDRAYWMSDMVVRGATFRPGDKGTVDVTSLARSDRVPATEAIVGVGENVAGGRDVCGDNDKSMTVDGWSVQGQRWLPGARQPVSNGLAATLTRVSSVRLDLPRMGLDVRRPLRLELHTDGESRLRLTGPWTGPITVHQTGAAPRRLCPTGGALDIRAVAQTSTISMTPARGACG